MSRILAEHYAMCGVMVTGQCDESHSQNHVTAITIWCVRAHGSRVDQT